VGRVSAHVDVALAGRRPLVAEHLLDDLVADPECRF
jgi:hypothetical protein